MGTCDAEGCGQDGAQGGDDRYAVSCRPRAHGHQPAETDREDRETAEKQADPGGRLGS